MAGTVSQNQISTYTTPINGAVGDASIVLSNDNTTRTGFNTHDADPTIHLQSSTLASRPAAGTAQRPWITTDGFRVYLDNGSSWDEIAYLKTTGGTLTGDLLFTDALYDIGKTGATRPRDGFFSRNLVVGGTLAVTGATTLTGAATLSSTLAVTGASTFTGIGGFAVDFGPNSTVTCGFASNTATFNWALGNSQYYPTALSANASITMTGSSNGRVYRGMIADPNGKTLTFTDTVHWLTAAPGSGTWTAGKAFVFVIWYLGATPYGQWAQEA